MAKNLTWLALIGFVAPLTFGSSGALAPERVVPPQACLPPPAPVALREVEVPDPAQRALVDHLSRRFYIASEATERMVEAAYRAAAEVGLDPLLVLAVISVESRFNPIAESVMGAKGLMQIIPKYHREKLLDQGGDDAVLDPESNILVGSRILQEYVYRSGSLEAGLQFYNGALRDESAQYAQKVMAERQRLEMIVRKGAKNA